MPCHVGNKGLAMNKIPVVENGWEYNGVTCPPDEHFIEYLEGQNIDKPTIVFHLGPGMHHKVGIWASTQKNVFVRAISITPPEVVEYMRLAADNPVLNSRYLVDFGDIHLLNGIMLPRIDYITLFHLGEISSQTNDPDYPGNNVFETIGMLYRRLSIRGKMVFFENSVGWRDIKSQVEVNLVMKYPCERSNYKSLTIFTKMRE